MNTLTCACFIAGLLTASPLWADDALDGLMDPSRPSSYGAATGGHGGGLVLQSTLVSPQRSVAIISGQRVAVGGKIAGADVVAIRPFEVTLSRAGRQSTLRMLPKSDVEKRLVEAAPHAKNP